jgi:hypothetical protein
MQSCLAHFLLVNLCATAVCSVVGHFRTCDPTTGSGFPKGWKSLCWKSREKLGKVVLLPRAEVKRFGNAWNLELQLIITRGQAWREYVSFL